MPPEKKTLTGPCACEAFGPTLLDSISEIAAVTLHGTRGMSIDLAPRIDPIRTGLRTIGCVPSGRAICCVHCRRVRLVFGFMGSKAANAEQASHNCDSAETLHRSHVDATTT
jgi:hypothetical protein